MDLSTVSTDPDAARAEIVSYFPEHAELFERNAALLKSVDKALAEQDLAVQRFSENVQKLVDARNARTARSRPTPPARM